MSELHAELQRVPYEPSPSDMREMQVERTLRDLAELMPRESEIETVLAEIRSRIEKTEKPS